MPQITLKKKQIDQFSAFLRKHDVKKWFLAKDDGAYIGATGGSDDDFERCIFYFRGMDPSKDEFAWDTARDAFGGDDFGEHFDAEIIHKLADDPLTTKMSVIVGRSTINIKSWARKVAPQPKPKKVWHPELCDRPVKPKATKKRGIGAFATHLIEKGFSNEDVLAAVKVEFPEAKTTLGCINWYRNKALKSA